MLHVIAWVFWASSARNSTSCMSEELNSQLLCIEKCVQRQEEVSIFWQCGVSRVIGAKIKRFS